MDKFEQAARMKLRFETAKGLLSVEDLFDLPLTSATGRANLDDIAKSINRQLRASAEETSFVEPHQPRKEDELQVAFDVVKHVIDSKVAERTAASEALKKRETKAKILEIIATKQDAELQGKSLEELRAMAEAM